MAGIATIGDHGFGRNLIVGLARIQYRPIQRRIGGIAVFDVEVRDKAVLFGRQVHLVAILNFARGFRDDVRVGFKQADELFRRGHAFAIKHPALRLIDDSEQQASVVFDFVDPDFGFVVVHRWSSHLFSSPLSSGGAILLSTTVLSMRSASSDPLSLASQSDINSLWICDSVSGWIRRTVACSDDLLGDWSALNRAKAR